MFFYQLTTQPSTIYYASDSLLRSDIIQNNYGPTTESHTDQPTTHTTRTHNQIHVLYLSAVTHRAIKTTSRRCRSYFCCFLRSKSEEVVIANRKTEEGFQDRYRHSATQDNHPPPLPLKTNNKISQGLPCQQTHTNPCLPSVYKTSSCRPENTRSLN